MKYTLFLHSDEASMTHVPPEAMAQMQAAFEGYTKALIAAGVFVATDWLKPSFTATTITLKDGARRVQDGPFSAAKEQIGGYYVIDVPDLDAALDWAAKCPAAQAGVVEVRPSAMG